MGHKHVQQLERVVVEGPSVAAVLRDAADVVDDVGARGLSLVSVAVTHQVDPPYVTVTYLLGEREE